VVMSCCGGGTVHLLPLTSHAVITHVLMLMHICV